MGKHHFLPARAKGAAVVATIVGLTGIGVAVTTEPSAAATSTRGHAFSPKAPPARVPLDAAVAARPKIRRLFRRLTLLWGLVIVIKGSLTLWLLLSLSTVDFVLIKTSAILTLTLSAAAATVVLSAIVGRQEGLLLPARHLPASDMR